MIANKDMIVFLNQQHKEYHPIIDEDSSVSAPDLYWWVERLYTNLSSKNALPASITAEHTEKLSKYSYYLMLYRASLAEESRGNLKDYLSLCEEDNMYSRSLDNASSIPSFIRV